MSTLPMVGPKALNKGDTIGIFTPSSPGYVWNEELFTNGLANLEKLGFKIKLGSLTAARASQGYRSGTPKERANEFMSLINDPDVHAVISTIGGYNSSSMIPHLDFTAIRDARKIFCGYSDVTSLHLAILKHARLTTVYGPSVMCWFGDWPNGCETSTNWFLDSVMSAKHGPREVIQPSKWSNHARRWDNGDWKRVPREWQNNEGWRTLQAGKVSAPIIALNLNTLSSAAGTSYWPELSGKILLIEDMEAPMARTERILNQLKFCGVFDQISGLIVGKPEKFDQQGAPFSYDDLILEVVGQRAYPIVTNFDCSHTLPMLAVPQLATVTIEASSSKGVNFTFEKTFIQST